MSRRLRILVVDDDRENADSLVELFSMEGHEVEVAYNGAQAIERYLSADYDVAFMDVVMPGLNGVESFLEIRRLKPGARVFMMTAYSVEQLLRQAIDNGALGVLNKPVDPERMLQEIDKLDPHGIAVLSGELGDVAEEVKEYIESSGRRCKTAQSPEEALRHAAIGQLDVLVLDLEGPLVAGLEVYTTLRRENLAMPTLLITPWEAELDSGRGPAGDLTVTGILNKPFDPARLLEQLAEFAA